MLSLSSTPHCDITDGGIAANFLGCGFRQNSSLNWRLQFDQFLYFVVVVKGKLLCPLLYFPFVQDLRHNECLLPRFSENAIHKQWSAGEGILAPLPPFIEAQPAKDTMQPLTLLMTRRPSQITVMSHTMEGLGLVHRWALISGFSRATGRYSEAEQQRSEEGFYIIAPTPLPPPASCRQTHLPLFD